MCILYQLLVADCGWLQIAATLGLCGERGDRTMRSGDCRPVAQSRHTSNGGFWLQQLQTLVNSFVRPLDVCQSLSVFLLFVLYLLREFPRPPNDQPSKYIRGRDQSHARKLTETIRLSLS